MVSTDLQPRNKRRKDDRPQEIIEAALLVFAESGYAAARLDDVAQRAGVAKGTIYLYFESKEDLFKAVVRAVVVSHIERVQGIIETFEGSSEDLLKTVLRSIAQEFVNSEMRHMARLMMVEGRKFPDITKFYFDEVISRGMANIRAIITRGVNSGEFRDTQITEFPQLIMSAPMMALMWKATFDHVHYLDLDRYFDTHIDILLNGLKKSG